MKKGLDQTFWVPTEIILGRGIAGQRVMVITDPGIAGAGLVDPIIDRLRKEKFEVDLFTEVEPDPSTTIVERALTLAADKGTDVFISVGGGSSIDTGKAVAFLLTNGGRFQDYVTGRQITQAPKTFITVPTTAGTGSEATFVAVISDGETHFKLAVLSPLLAPKVAVIDPQMLLTVPPKVATYTGIDALTHALEAFTSTKASGYSDAVAIQASRLILENLERFILEERDLDIAEKMAIGSTLAGIAFTNSSTCLAHAMAMALGSYYSIPHGLAVGVVLPFALKFNIAKVPLRFGELAYLCDLAEKVVSAQDAASCLLERVLTLLERIGIPKSLGELGVDLSLIPELSKRALS